MTADIGAYRLDRVSAKRRFAPDRLVCADIHLIAHDLGARADPDIGSAAQVHTDLALPSGNQGNRARIHADVDRLRLRDSKTQERCFDTGAIADLDPGIQIRRQFGAIDRHRQATDLQRARLGLQAGDAVAVGAAIDHHTHHIGGQAGVVGHRLERAAQARLGAHHAYADHPARDGLGVGAAEVTALRMDIHHARAAILTRCHPHAIEDCAIARLGQRLGRDINQGQIGIDSQPRGCRHAGGLGAAEVHSHSRIDIDNRCRHGSLSDPSRCLIACDILRNPHPHGRANRADGDADLGQIDVGQHFGIRQHRHQAQGTDLTVAGDPGADLIACVVADAHPGARPRQADCPGRAAGKRDRGGHRLQIAQRDIFQSLHRQRVVGAELLAACRIQIGLDHILDHRVDQRHNQRDGGAGRQHHGCRHPIGGGLEDFAIVFGAHGERSTGVSQACHHGRALNISRGPCRKAIADLHARCRHGHPGADHCQRPREIHAA